VLRVAHPSKEFQALVMETEEILVSILPRPWCLQREQISFEETEAKVSDGFPC
jgi:hypothetical protein